MLWCELTSCGSWKNVIEHHYPKKFNETDARRPTSCRQILSHHTWNICYNILSILFKSFVWMTVVEIERKYNFATDTYWIFYITTKMISKNWNRQHIWNIPHWRIQRGGGLGTPPVRFLSFSCSCWQKSCQIIGAPVGNPGSATVLNSI